MSFCRMSSAHLTLDEVFILAVVEPLRLLTLETWHLGNKLASKTRGKSCEDMWGELVTSDWQALQSTSESTDNILDGLGRAVPTVLP